MGSSVGTFNDDELSDLSASDRKKLKQHAIKHLASSKEIRAIISRNPKLLAEHPQINKVLRKKLHPVLKRLKKAKKK